MNPSQRIDQLIADLTDWRGKTLASIRKSILEAEREIIEEWKWMGSPVWSRDGMIAVGNAHKDKVKLTFSNGASLPDPDKLFNAGLEGNKWRAIDFFEGDKINESALRNLVRDAVDYNQIKLKRKASAGTRAKPALNVVDAFVSKNEASRRSLPVITRICGENPSGFQETRITA
jgi:hypothetical protein